MSSEMQAGVPSADLTRFEWIVARWTVLQGVTALIACVAAAAATFATWKQAIHNGQQIEQNNTLLRARLYSQSVSNSTDIYRILIDKPKLRKYIYDGQDIDDKHADYDEFAGLADTIIDVFDATLIFMDIHDSHGGSPWPGRVGWHAWMVDLISTSPGLRRYFAASKEYYIDNPKLLAVFDEGERKAAKKSNKKR